MNLAQSLRQAKAQQIVSLRLFPGAWLPKRETQALSRGSGVSNDAPKLYRLAPYIRLF